MIICLRRYTFDLSRNREWGGRHLSSREMFSEVDNRLENNVSVMTAPVSEVTLSTLGRFGVGLARCSPPSRTGALPPPPCEETGKF
jgi:hypothetical protein